MVTIEVRTIRPEEGLQAAALLEPRSKDTAGLISPLPPADGSPGPPPFDLAGRPLTWLGAFRGPELLGLVAITEAGDIGDWLVPVRPGGIEAGAALLDAAEDFGRSRGLPHLEILLPAGSSLDDADFFRRGFRDVAAPAATLRVLDFPALLDPLARSRSGKLAALAPLAIVVALEKMPAPDPDHPEFTIRIEASGASVTAGAAPDAGARLTVRAARLAAHVFSAAGAEAFRTGAVVEPEAARRRVLAAIDALRIEAPWHTPRWQHR